jgi:nucleoside-diphosphate-sugar epimerase
MTLPLVLVTGSAGRIGRAVVKELVARGHRVRGFDRVPTPGLTDAVVGSITDAAACAKATADIHTLIHLAATPDDVEDVVGDLVPNNVVGVYRIFEAARLAGVKRMVLASSGQVVWNQRKTGPLPIGVDVQPTPRYWYAAMKMFLEAAGRAYADTHGISVIAVRLGWCVRVRGRRRKSRPKRGHRTFTSVPATRGGFSLVRLRRRRPSNSPLSTPPALRCGAARTIWSRRRRCWGMCLGKSGRRGWSDNPITGRRRSSQRLS